MYASCHENSPDYCIKMVCSVIWFLTAQKLSVIVSAGQRSTNWNLCAGFVLPFVVKPAKEALGFTPAAEKRSPPTPRQVCVGSVSESVCLLEEPGSHPSLSLQVVENAFAKEQ